MPATGCSSRLPSNYENVLVAATLPAAWTTPRAAAGLAPPAILAMRFSSLFVPRGSDWNGDIVATSNTTSVELFTNLYSFDVPKTGTGRFKFSVHLFDVPAFLVRPYVLHVIARNVAGVRVDTSVPFEIGGRP
ncbi:MAG: hypothetical protein IAI50_17800 [Candidatus Eremiobacteraeota bacterium]|nr:hypothetical protein [Candidatus Eremiobacteraeota bacterium]